MTLLWAIVDLPRRRLEPYLLSLFTAVNVCNSEQVPTRVLPMHRSLRFYQAWLSA